MKKYLAILALTILPQIAFAAYSIPLTGTTTTGTIYGFPAFVNGAYPNLMAPFFYSTSTTNASIFPFASSTAFSATTICLTSDICRSTWPSGSGTTVIPVATSSAETAGNLAYWTSTGGTPATLGKIATTTLTLSGFPANIPSTYGKLVGGADTTWTWWGLSTTTNLTAGQVLYASGPNGVTSVATGTISSGTGISLDNATRSAIGGSLQITNSSPLSGLSASYPFSFSNPTLSWLGLSTTTNSGMSQGSLYVGSGGIFQTAASSSIFGYTPLNPTRQLTISSGNGLITLPTTAQDLSADRTWTLTYTGLATTTALTGGQLLYSNGTNGVTGIGTTTQTFSGPFAITPNMGALVGGSNATINYTGLATTTALTGGNLLVSNGTNGVFGIATSSETCSSGISCTAHTVLTGGGAITLDALGSAGVLGAQTATTPTVQATSTLYGNATGGQVLGWVNGGIGWVATSTTGSSPGGTTSQLQYNGAGSVFLGVSTTTLGFSGPFTVPVTLGALVGGSNTTITYTGLSTSTALTGGRLLYSDGTKNVTDIATTTVSITGPFTIPSTYGSLVGGSGSITFTGLSTSTALTGGQLLYTDGTKNVTNVGTTTLSLSSAYSYSGTLGSVVGGVGGTLSSVQTPAFSYATTSWTGTTTIPIGPAFYAETWNAVKCFTDVGTLNVSFNDGSNRMDMLNASTTVGTFNLVTNNSFTAGEKRYVDIGTPASSPTKISCTVNKTI